MGWECLEDGRHVYVAGNRVLGNLVELDYRVDESLSAIKLFDDEALSDKEALKAHLFNLSRNPSSASG